MAVVVAQIHMAKDFVFKLFHTLDPSAYLGTIEVTIAPTSDEVGH